MRDDGRSVWAGGMVLVSFGVRIGIRTTDVELLRALIACFPPGWAEGSSLSVEHLYSLHGGGLGPWVGLRRFHVLTVNGIRLARSLDFADVVEAFRSDLHLRVAEFARARVFVHAGVVGWQGGAIVIPGRSYSGKSTLVAALVRAGAQYYSDEFAVLDRQGRVHPYPRPLSLRQANGGRPLQLTADALGGCTGKRPLPLAHLVLTRFRAAACWLPSSCSSGRAVLALLNHTISARRRPAAVLAVLQKAITHAAILKGTRGEADELAHWLLGPAGRSAAGTRAGESPELESSPAAIALLNSRFDRA